MPTTCKPTTAAEVLTTTRAFLRENLADPDTISEIDAIGSHFLQTGAGQPVPGLPEHLIPALRQLLGLPPLPKTKAKRRVREEREPYQALLDLDWGEIPYPPPTNPKFTFIDLFAGIGGFRIAFQDAGGKCVFTSEWDKYAKKTYEANFGEVPYGDIRKVDKASIPDHDVLCAGFPCQPFSLAGVSKKNSLGRPHGFRDKTQGTLFFEIMEILFKKRPRAFILENVKNLVSHDRGATIDTIYRALREELKYVVKSRIIDGANWVPQHRERIFIVGFNPDKVFSRHGDPIGPDDFDIPEKPLNGYRRPELATIIQKNVANHTLGPGTWETLERHKARHAAAGNGFGYGLHEFPIKKGSVTRTISARYHKDGAEILIMEKGSERPRRLTVDEAKQLQGFDPGFRFPVSNTQAYRQIGNSVVVPAVGESAKMIAEILLHST